MFSRILLLALAISAVSAAPKVARADCALVEVLSNSRYTINASKKCLNQVRTTGLNAALTVQEGRTGPAGVWDVVKIATDKYHLVNLENGLLAAVNLADPALVVASTNLTTFQSTWAIEPAGANLWTIKVPDVDLVWAYNTNDKEISLKGQFGLPEEQWIFELL
ncbi:hypothetical protein B0H13DRAFT_1916634 [Mycena leptocephala]|nr:hypothetical protein B0H13DRAFT_1916634 [Mycena leptocephala]